MIRRFSSPQIIIVHRWQIIMYETHGMNHLERHCRGHGSLLRPPEHFACCNAQHGAYAFPSRHEGVGHRFADLIGLWDAGLDGCLKRLFDGTFFGEQVFVEAEGG